MRWRCFREFSNEDQQRIREVLDTITSGQELDLKRFADARAKSKSSRCKPKPNWTITLIASPAVLANSGRRFAWRINLRHPELTFENSFEELGVRFGKGLQLVNILRDLPADLRNGRCYLPADKLAEAGLAPADLLTRERNQITPALRPLSRSCGVAFGGGLGIHESDSTESDASCVWLARGRF